MFLTSLVPASVRSGETVYAPDVTADERYVHNNPSTLSELVVPLRTAQGVIGVLDLQSGQYDAFDQHEFALAQCLADEMRPAPNAQEPHALDACSAL